jgi:hypothetical protein
MADNNNGTDLDSLTQEMNDIAREVGEMDPNDPLRQDGGARTRGRGVKVKGPAPRRHRE